MTYNEAIELLYTQFQSFQQKGKEAFSGKLDPINRLCNRLNNPQNNYPVIHVAGTNGKGSTASVIASILKEHGLKTGLYTSPHLYDFRERIRIDGEMIAEEDVSQLTSELIEINENLPLSFFEMTTTMAFQYFKNKKVDIAVIETGLGGRLDSTNICENKLAAIITPIGMDHTTILGDTLDDIALEKAGIVPHSNFCISSYVNDTVNPIIQQFCDKHHIPFSILSKPEVTYSTDLSGTYQQHNIHLAVTATIQCLPALHKTLNSKKMEIALLNVKKNSGLRGRFEKVAEKPEIIFDVAHNEQGIQTLFNTIEKTENRHLHLVCGFSGDKDLPAIFKTFQDNGNISYYLTTPGGERGIKKEQYQLLEKKLNVSDSHFFDYPQEALEKAKKRAKENDVIIVFGSFFIFEKINLRY